MKFYKMLQPGFEIHSLLSYRFKTSVTVDWCIVAN